MTLDLFSLTYQKMIQSIVVDDFDSFKDYLNIIHSDTEFNKKYQQNFQGAVQYFSLLIKYKRYQMTEYAVDKEISTINQLLDILKPSLSSNKLSFEYFTKILKIKGNINSKPDLEKCSSIIILLLEKPTNYLEEFLSYQKLTQFDSIKLIKGLDNISQINQESFNYLFEFKKNIDNFFIYKINNKSNVALEAFLNFYKSSELLKKEQLFNHISKSTFLNKDVYEKILLNEKLHTHLQEKVKHKTIKI